MRLREKKQIASDLATQRKTDIDKGIALATKVDAVRDTLAKETRDLENFRAHATASVREEIDILLKNRFLLEKEIEQAKKDLAVLRLPLDEEWDLLRSQQYKVAQQEQQLQAQAFDVQKRLDSVLIWEKEIFRKEDRLEVLLQEAAFRSLEANTLLSQAKEETAELRNNAQSILFEIEIREQSTAVWEANLEVREKSLIIREEQAVLKEKELRDQELNLISRFADLERTAERIRKGNL